MRDKIDPSKYMKGEVRAFSVPLVVKCGRAVSKSTSNVMLDFVKQWTPTTEFRHNDFLYEWGAIFANLLMRKGLNYGIGGMYLEFENTASPGDPVSPPAFTRDADQGVDYYNGLSLSSDRDYLRVPLIASTLDISDATNFPKGNQPSFFAQTVGVAGVHGKPFSDANNSTVFGGALVAFVDEEDHTRDIVLSRFYLDVDKQQPKLSTSQIGFEWRLTLG